jgi:hypothetical protein
MGSAHGSKRGNAGDEKKSKGGRRGNPPVRERRFKALGWFLGLYLLIVAGELEEGDGRRRSEEGTSWGRGGWLLGTRGGEEQVWSWCCLGGEVRAALPKRTPLCIRFSFVKSKLIFPATHYIQTI